MAFCEWDILSPPRYDTNWALLMAAANIQFMLWGTTAEVKVMGEQMRKFERLHPGLSVRLVHVPGTGKEFQQKFLTMVAAGTPPDLAFAFTDIFYAHIHRGALMDLTEMVAWDPDFRRGALR